MLATKNPQIGKAVGILMDLSADERTRLLEESHQKALWDYNSRLKAAVDKGTKEGEARGVKQGEARGVQKEKRELLALIEKGYTMEQLRGVLTRQESGRL